MPSFITLNPALDLSTAAERVQPTHKLRCGAVQRQPPGPTASTRWPGRGDARMGQSRPSFVTALLARARSALKHP